MVMYALGKDLNHFMDSPSRIAQRVSGPCPVFLHLDSLQKNKRFQCVDAQCSRPPH